MELYEKMKQIAINDHVAVLNLIKEFFFYIRYSKSDRYKYFDLSSHLNTMNELKIKSIRMYQKLLHMFPDDQVNIFHLIYL